MRSRRMTATAGLLATLLLCGAAAAQQSSTSGLIKPGEAPYLEIVHSGDVIGYLDPCG